MPTRRMLFTLGGGVIVAAAGAVAFPLGLADPAAAWAVPDSESRDPRRFALSYALLAPNPHNMQPWLADLSEPDVVTLRLDTARLLPASDPYGRQILIGCGAFLELLTMAAGAAGYRIEIVLFPEGQPAEALDGRAFARLHFVPAAPVVDPLFRHALARRTNRLPFEVARVPAAADLRAIAAAGSSAGGVKADFATAPAQVAALRAMVWQGWMREQATPAALRESVDVMWIGDRAIAANRYGIGLGGPAMNMLAASGLADRATLLDPGAWFNRQGAQQWHELAYSAPAFLWQVSVDNSRATQIATGRAYLRLALAATAHGLAVHPWSMALQEYPEMAPLYARQQAMLGGSAAAPVQMLVRIGYADTVPPAPRRGLQSVLQDA